MLEDFSKPNTSIINERRPLWISFTCVSAPPRRGSSRATLNKRNKKECLPVRVGEGGAFSHRLRLVWKESLGFVPCIWPLAHLQPASQVNQVCGVGTGLGLPFGLRCQYHGDHASVSHKGKEERNPWLSQSLKASEEQTHASVDVQVECTWEKKPLWVMCCV